jgi:two-component system OmpR family sensor kinase
LASACVGWFSARRAVRPLASALALQREFVADASHELRTPLTLLSTRAQLLHQDLLRAGVGATEVADAQGVVTDAGRLADVVDDLLAAADHRADQVRQTVDLHTIAQDVVASVQPYADTRQVRLVLQPADAPLRVAVTVTAVRRALLALVDNAVLHTPAHGEVVLGLSRDRTVVRVTVTDSGAGIPASQVPRLFRRFASGEQQATRRGYGLGLFLARDVADRHGGQLRLLSDGPDEGASFAFELRAEP